MNTDDLGYQTIIFADVNKRQYAVKAYDLALVSKVGFVAKLDRLYERVENTRAGGVATRLVNLFTWDGPF